MRSNARFPIRTVLAGLAVAAMLAMALAIVSTQVLARANPARPISASQAQSAAGDHTQQVVNAYLAAVNQGMSSSACDFSGLTSVASSDMRVTVTGGPFAAGGPFGSGGSFGEHEYDGIQAVTGFYTKFCHFLYRVQTGTPSWTQDAGYTLAPTVLDSYEHVSFSGHLAGRCMHVFVVEGNVVQSLDWSVYA